MKISSSPVLFKIRLLFNGSDILYTELVRSLLSSCLSAQIMLEIAKKKSSGYFYSFM